MLFSLAISGLSVGLCGMLWLWVRWGIPRGHCHGDPRLWRWSAIVCMQVALMSTVHRLHWLSVDSCGLDEFLVRGKAFRQNTELLNAAEILNCRPLALVDHEHSRHTLFQPLVGRWIYRELRLLWHSLEAFQHKHLLHCSLGVEW